VSLTLPSEPPHRATSLCVPVRKPILLRLAPLFLVVLGLGNGIVGALFLLERHSVAWPASGFLSGAWAQGLVLLGLMALGGVLLAAAWGLWADRMWARPLVVGCGAVMALFPLLAGGMTGGVASLLPWIVGVALTWAYLYDSRGVVAYYAWLEGGEAAGSG